MTVRAAVIGLGYWGPNIARNLSQLEGAELAEVCDVDPKRLEVAASRWPHARRSQNPVVVFANPDIDAVAITTPASSHFALAKAALEHEKHVFVEKPLALTSSEAEELVELARARGRVLMVDHTFDYHPAVQHMEMLIRSGGVGQVHYISSQRLSLGIVRQDVNALWNLAPHDVSILLRLLGEEPAEITATGGAYLQPGIEDVVFITLRFPSGAIGHVHVSWLDPRKVRLVTVVGSKKMAVFDDVTSEERLKLYDKGFDRPERYESYGEFLTLRSGEVVAPRIPSQEPLRLACADFVKAIQTGSFPRSDGEAGLRVVRVLEAAQAALRGRAG
ncbi:MAG TPA: Gfo/Idh/MocA family oxidoreductase [Candidatus Acetothermia bacterium]|nr:Gfo/Idh/MocA family oxidoreductase [Candidatus Acetothermia bacterium]